VEHHQEVSIQASTIDKTTVLVMAYYFYPFTDDALRG
jgi:hypothetical protein